MFKLLQFTALATLLSTGALAQTNPSPNIESVPGCKELYPHSGIINPKFQKAIYHLEEMYQQFTQHLAAGEARVAQHEARKLRNKVQAATDHYCGHSVPPELLWDHTAMGLEKGSWAKIMRTATGE